MSPSAAFEELDGLVKLVDVWDAGMVSRPGAGSGPEKLAGGLDNRHVVDAGLATSHQSTIVELPQFVAVRPVPLAGIIVPFVLETDCDPPVGKGPEFLDKAVLVLPAPFPCQEFLNLLGGR